MNENEILPFSQNKFKLITCAVLARECYYCASAAENTVDIQIVDQGLHDVGQEKMSSRLQKEIDRVDSSEYEAILLGYGLCNNGTAGLKSALPLVIPRAHDCITLLLGSKEKYQNLIEKNARTYFQSAGWLEHHTDYNSNPESTTVLMGLKKYDDYVKEYGEENAKYLIEQLGGGLQSYDKIAFIDTGVGNQAKLKEHSQDNARSNGWRFEELDGDTGLLLKMMNGIWDESDFIVVPPEHTMEPSYDWNVIRIR